MKLLLATGNSNKLREARVALALVGVEVLGLQDLELAPAEPAENEATFVGNARVKAVGYALATGRACLAEDSGLVVDMLDGAPGVLSARYAGTTGERDERDAANNRKLLSALEGVEDERRKARYVCALCLANSRGEVIATAQGEFHGQITTTPRGDGGFGYDPLFGLPELGKTAAELSPAEKAALSHRGQALRQLVQVIREQTLSFE